MTGLDSVDFNVQGIAVHVLWIRADRKFLEQDFGFKRSERFLVHTLGGENRFSDIWCRSLGTEVR